MAAVAMFASNAHPVTEAGSWQTAPSMTQTRARHSATLLPNGKVLVSGGCVAWEDRVGVCKQVTASTELYDAQKGKWENGRPMKIARMGHSATLLHSGKVLVAGGCVLPVSGGLFGCKSTTASSELYDPSSGRWSDTGEMKWSRTDHPEALIPAGPSSACGPNCGKVLVTGNRPESLGGMQAVNPELYDPGSGIWEQTAMTLSPSIPGDCCVPSLTTLKNGNVLLAGTVYASDDPLKTSASFYYPTTGTWKPTAGQPKIRRFLASVTELENGSVLVAGGHPGLNEPSIAQAEVFEPSQPDSGRAGENESWQGTGRMTVARRAHRAVLLKTGHVLVMGGGVEADSGPAAPATGGAPLALKLIRSAELYDPETKRWSPGGQMATGRGDTLHDRSRAPDFTATLLKDGRVLVSGGAVPVSPSKDISVELHPRTSVKEVEIYTPAGFRSSPVSRDAVRAQDREPGLRWWPLAGLGAIVLSALALLVARQR